MIGMTWLIFGAINYHIADWDVGISLIMGGLTYLCAPWSVKTLLDSIRNRPKYWPQWILASNFVAWLVVDGVYFIYHKLMGNIMFRSENFYASSALYFLAGTIWLYRGSMRDFFQEIISIAKK